MFKFLTQEAKTIVVQSSLKARESQTDCVLVAQLVEAILEQNPHFAEEVSLNMETFYDLANNLYATRHCRTKNIGLTPPFSEASRGIIIKTQHNAEFKKTLGDSRDLFFNAVTVVSENVRLMREPIYSLIVETFSETHSYAE